MAKAVSQVRREESSSKQRILIEAEDTRTKCDANCRQMTRGYIAAAKRGRCRREVHLVGLEALGLSATTSTLVGTLGDDVGLLVLYRVEGQGESPNVEMEKEDTLRTL